METPTDRTARYTLHLKSVVHCKTFSYNRDKRVCGFLSLTSLANRLIGPESYDITGSRETLKEASLLFIIHPMHLTAQDQHELQLEPTKVPNPRFKESYSFRLPLGFSIS